MQKGNKGEWSEFYAFLKILSEGKLFAADKNIKRITDKFFHVLQVVREEADSGKKFYDIFEEPGNIIISDSEKKRLGAVPQVDVASKIDQIFEDIMKKRVGTFEVPLAQTLMEDLLCTKIRAGSGRKADLFLKVYDSITPETPDLGFSIKSALDSPSTLLNASGATNFIFKIEGVGRDILGINSIKTKNKIRDRMDRIKNLGGTLVYERTSNQTFEKNLRKIDTAFPRMMAETLKVFFEGRGNALVKISEVIHSDGHLAGLFEISQNDYEIKLKLFLVAIALGMMPAKEWDGRTLAHGGYIIVKKDGDVLCHHLYNRDQFEDYLFLNTKLETGGSSKHKFGVAYEEAGQFFIKLNLQIRFVK